MTATKTSNLKLWYMFAAGALTLVVLVGIARLALTQQTKLSCRTPKTTSTEYCVYARVTPGPFVISSNYQLLVGPSADRGLLYETPYNKDQTDISWSDDDTLIITQPDSVITIRSAGYIDTR